MNVEFNQTLLSKLYWSGSNSTENSFSNTLRAKSLKTVHRSQKSHRIKELK